MNTHSNRDVLDRCQRADDAQFYTDQMEWDEFAATVNMLNPLISGLSPAQKQRVKRQALKEFAADNGITVNEVRRDFEISGALDRIEEIDLDVAQAIQDDLLAVSPQQILRLGRLDQKALKKRVRELRETLRDYAEHHLRWGELPE